MRRRPGLRHARREPMFNVPAGVVWTIAIFAAVHLALDQLPAGRGGSGPAEREWWQIALAFVPSRYAAGPVLPGDPGAAVWTFITHQLVHADWVHLGVNSAWWLAFGGALAMRIGFARCLLLGLASGIAGAGLFLCLRLGELSPMVGASGAISGLMGAAFRYFFVALDLGGLHLYRGREHEIPRMAVAETLRDVRGLMSVASFAVLNLSIGIALFVTWRLAAWGWIGPETLGWINENVRLGIAWEAHLGGFLFGLLAFAVFDRQAPGIARPEPADEQRPPRLY